MYANRLLLSVTQLSVYRLADTHAAVQRTLTNFRQLNDTRILEEFHQQRIVLIDFDGAIVAAANNFIFAIIVGIDECKGADIATGDHPQTLLALSVIPTNVFCRRRLAISTVHAVADPFDSLTISAHNHQRLVAASDASDDNRQNAFHNLLVENVVVVVDVIGQQLGGTANHQDLFVVVCRQTSRFDGANFLVEIQHGNVTARLRP